MTATPQSSVVPAPPAEPRGRPPLVLQPWRPSAVGAIVRVAVLAALVALVASLPILVPEVYLNVLSRTVVFAIVGLSLNLLVGYTGQVSLGHNAFFGVGPFAAGYALSVLGLPWAGGVAVAVLTGVVAALPLGFVALRLRGLYLALVTLAYGQFAVFVVFSWRPLTGGGAGMPADRPFFATGDMAYAYLCLAVLALVLAFDWQLMRTRAGRAIRALRDNERVAASWGINVTAYKLLAFTISGVIAAIGGALFASIEQVVVSPDFEFLVALNLLILVVIGGVANRWGVLLGAAFLIGLPEVADAVGGSGLGETFQPVIGTVVLLLVLTLFPGGLAQLVRPLLRWLSFQPLRRYVPAETVRKEG
jgi:branched-chain amino acid transport system permease protein